MPFILAYLQSLLSDCNTYRTQLHVFLLHFEYLEHISGVLKNLHWLPVHARIDFKTLILTYKDVHGTAPLYKCDLIMFCNIIYVLTVTFDQFNVPLLNKSVKIHKN